MTLLCRISLACIVVASVASFPSVPAVAEVMPVANPLKPDPMRKAEVFFKGGDYPEALEVAERSLEKRLTRPQQARAYWLVGKSHEALGSPDKALSVYQVAVRIHPKDTELLLALGDLFWRVGLEDRALPQYQSVLRWEPGSAAAHVGVGRILLSQGLFAMAAPHFDAAMNGRETPEAVLGLGRAFSGAGRLEDAERVLRSGLKAGGGVEMRVALAEVQKRRGALPEAIESLRQAAADAPERSDVRLRHAAWLLGTGRVEEAAVGLRAALRETPDDPLARFLLGFAALRRGQGSAAAKEFQVVADQDRHPFLREAAMAAVAAVRPQGTGHGPQ